METKKILESFSVINDNQIFPYEQMEQAVASRDEITPELLAALDYVYQNAETLYENDDPYSVHLYAMFLLAQFREKKAFVKLIQILTLNNDYLEFLVGDAISDDYPMFLYSTYGGQLNLLHEIIENVDLDIFTRICALEVCDKLFEKGEIDRSEHLDYLRFLVKNYANEGSGNLGGFITNMVVDLHLTELIDSVNDLYSHDNVDLMYAGDYDEFIDQLFSNKSSDSNRDLLLKDAAESFSSWAAFKQKPSKINYKEIERQLKKFVGNESRGKIGRNELCPCGSGKKYKKCCLDKDEAAVLEGKDPNVERSKALLLKDYPSLSEASDGHHAFVDFYDTKAIDIDIDVYKALHRQMKSIFEKRNIYAESQTKIEHLTDAFRKFEALCDAEHITSFADFDKKYMVHYFSDKWISTFLRILDVPLEMANPSNSHLHDLQNEVKNTIETMSN